MHSLLAKHWSALVIATLVGLVCVAPHVYFAVSTPNYAGIALIGSDGEGHYAARINQIYAGHLSLGNTFLPNKNQPYLQPALGEIIVAGVGKITGMSASQVNTFSKFLFPFLVTLLLYAFAYALFSSRLIGLFAALFALFGDNLISGPNAWIGLLQGTSSATDFLPYVRPINPEVSGLFFFAALYIFYRVFAVRGLPRLWESIAVGVLTGASLYMTPYTFTFLVLFLGISFLWFLRRKAYQNALHLVYAGATAFILLIPFLFNYIALVAHPDYADTAMRYGLIVSHAPALGIWILLMLGLSLFLWPKQYKDARIFFIISGITLLVLTNQQILTGHALQLSHYHWYITKPLVGIMLGMFAVVIAQYIFRNKLLRNGVYLLAALIFLYNAALVQIYSYQAHYAYAAAAQTYAPTLAYLNTIPTKQTAWANKSLSVYIPLYTKHNAPNNDYASSYLVGNDFLVERMLLQYRLSGILPSDIAIQLKVDRATVSGQIFQLYWRDQGGSYDAIPDSYLDAYAAQYKNIYAKPLPQLFKDMGATMIVWDKAADASWHIDLLPFAHKTFEDGSIAVYQLDTTP